MPQSLAYAHQCFQYFVDFLSQSNDPRVDTLPRMQDITRDVMSCRRQNSVQDCCCGRGKVVLKNCESDKDDVSKAAPRLKEWDVTLAILLFLLAMFCVRRGAAWRQCILPQWILLC